MTRSKLSKQQRPQRVNTRLMRAIKASGKAQYEIADHVGVTEASISNYINMKSIPKLHVAHSLATLLGEDVRNLFLSPEIGEGEV